ncbi:undecaprenyl-diphosphate phosphatase [Oharaeibacter diazotrophicus]|uniref:Undecaprenyl-diphosphatase n=1 Tax=Oharaeibacter diazotrophicus TaxID=1920512 RepID=A0A4R6R692_9HYPH|nr:undecaprenyl-diphosphate phosphatase [Oharaeibacter diazotrophicus]TDP81461.1 undecaprenyl-diphosphatase [Oharaeibacter diazotrophicus]BBE73699.1 undecaprenyl-diphosphatase [Pleomorphomonas sp. SM30]GLS75488.1 undecaprenyl-diphosphatase 1 [Oharaeibacter diazotrophicus]
MDWLLLLKALVLGFVEGLTEFIPVSSTGHLLLLGHFLGFKSTGRTFEVLIQLGAILAILAVYADRLWQIAMALPSEPLARRFVLGVLVAFFPAVIVGVIAHDFIKTVLFETPALVCTTLILGGIVLLVIDRRPPAVRFKDPTRYPWTTYLAIGLFQCLAMVPGVSRSGSTIVGAMLLGVSKRSAAEFSFYLAMPTMAGAFAYDLYKNRDALSMDDAATIGVGFLAAFVAALLVVRALLDFVGRHGYAPFGWWRIAVGTAGLAGLWLVG